MPPKGYRKWRHPTRTPTYISWAGMFTRCYQPACRSYDDYGRRGIIVCKRWHDYDLFYEDMGERPAGMTLHRIDNDGNYELGNCCWATSEEQARNKSTSAMLTYNGKTQCVMAWAEELGLNEATIRHRLYSGLTVEEALETPIRGSG